MPNALDFFEEDLDGEQEDQTELERLLSQGRDAKDKLLMRIYHENPVAYEDLMNIESGDLFVPVNSQSINPIDSQDGTRDGKTPFYGRRGAVTSRQFYERRRKVNEELGLEPYSEIPERFQAIL